MCCVCNEPFTRRGHKASARQYHDDCRPVVLKQMRPLHGQARWQRQSPEQQQATLDKAHQHTLERQAETKGKDHNRLRRWTRAEDEVILYPDALPDHELALELGRTLYAVRGRRLILRKRQHFIDADITDDSA